ncbi:GTP cyclohydrolase II [Micromonospora chersina]|uniref:hypothetical protein n=1 Tax=Micromonospora chersina TaxID=47854 RepID=UPI0037167606
MIEHVPVEIGAEVRLPTKYGDLTMRYARQGDTEAVVVVKATGMGGPVPVRVQSSCVFSESFGALDCDCADQLDAALSIISDGGGCLIYVYEEGRGAGLAKKFAAVRLQAELGIDTATAFHKLGMPPDLRDYRLASAVIKEIYGDSSVVVLTNDPRKLARLRENGVAVSERRPLVVAKRAIVADYLEGKSRVLGHLVHES